MSRTHVNTGKRAVPAASRELSYKYRITEGLDGFWYVRSMPLNTVLLRCQTNAEAHRYVQAQLDMDRAS